MQQSHGVFPSLVSNEARSLFCLPFAALLVLLFRWDDALARLRSVRLLSWVGLFSYGLYLSHYIALRVVDQGAARVPLAGTYPCCLPGQSHRLRRLAVLPALRAAFPEHPAAAGRAGDDGYDLVTPPHRFHLSAPRLLRIFCASGVTY